ncbi:MAG TPA: CotH kinase family protein, partial [Polyangia bacterium]|nr:CotH kinase family protein [Polyangia bacterium]
WKDREKAGLDIKPYHPAVFRYGDEVATDAFIKLQGNPSSSWTGNKMRFTVDFNRLDKNKRFHRLRKIVLHASPSEQSFLRERLATSYMRSLGLPAACENNARLMVNGRFYGLFTNREAADDEMLQRIFPDGHGGDLWKSGFALDNKKIADHADRHDALMKTPDVATMSQMVDLDETLLDWAAEAMLPNDDGYWGVNHNFYIYDHPTRGFLWLPYDLDATFDFVEFSADPITRVPSWSAGWGVHQQAVMADPALVARFVTAVERAWEAYDVDVLKARLNRWSAQIAAAVKEDNVKPFSTADNQLAIARMNGFFYLRSKHVRSWLDCMQSGTGDDSDHDGFIWCHDCNDRDPAINPGAAEICGNSVDENCNGRKDDCR